MSLPHLTIGVQRDEVAGVEHLHVEPLVGALVGGDDGHRSILLTAHHFLLGKAHIFTRYLMHHHLDNSDGKRRREEEGVSTGRKSMTSVMLSV